MTIPIMISITALLISFASFTFSLIQYRANKRLKKVDKINEVLRMGFDLRRKSQDLRDLINQTDDIDSHEEILNPFDEFCEGIFVSVLSNPKTNLHEIFEVEKGILEMNLEFDLFVKSVNEQIRFNEECREFNKNKV